MKQEEPLTLVQAFLRDYRGLLDKHNIKRVEFVEGSDNACGEGCCRQASELNLFDEKGPAGSIYMGQLEL